MNLFCLLITSFSFLMPFSGLAQQRVLFFGDSITAGYGLSAEQAFPALLQERADSLGLNVEIINGGLSGETSSGGLRRIDWVLQNRVDVFVLELGGNDGLRGIDLALTEKNLNGILEKVKSRYPQAKLIVAGMQVPPNLGQDYTRAFAQIFPRVAEKHGAILIPFILENVGGIQELNQPDGIHPTGEGHVLIANTVWTFLKPLLN